MTNYLSYSNRNSGLSATWSRWLSEYVNGSVSIFGEQLRYSDPQDGLCPDLIPLICRQLGTQSSTGFRTPFHAIRATTISILAAGGVCSWCGLQDARHGRNEPFL